MDKEIVSTKLETLRRCVQRLKEKTPESVTLLQGDDDLQDIVCLNLERAIQVCVDLASHIIADADLAAPSTMAETFDQLERAGVISADLAARMKRAVGFRNIAVHSYQLINWSMVFSILTTRLDDFRSFAAAIARAAHL
jgi:uncharacterized protein YutE (UPF0331/DUF86 family)